MHLYAFGSLCRGDVDLKSDIDLLAIVNGRADRLDPEKFSIYSYTRIEEIWALGNPFAWHLHLESRILYAPDQKNFIASLGTPSTYTRAREDCVKFLTIFQIARRSLEEGTPSPIFELSSVFLAVRNLATCFSLGEELKPDFSRYSSLRLGSNSLPIEQESFTVLERSRILSTRGKGELLSKKEIECSMGTLSIIEQWMKGLILKTRELKLLKP